MLALPLLDLFDADYLQLKSWSCSLSSVDMVVVFTVFDSWTAADSRVVLYAFNNTIYIVY